MITGIQRVKPVGFSLKKLYQYLDIDLESNI